MLPFIFVALADHSIFAVFISLCVFGVFFAFGKKRPSPSVVESSLRAQKEQHDKAVKDLSVQHEKALKDVSVQHERKVSQLKEEEKQKRESTQAKHVEELEHLRMEHSSALNGLAERHSAELERFKKENSAVRTEEDKKRTELQKQLESAKKKLDEDVAIVERKFQASEAAHKKAEEDVKYAKEQVETMKLEMQEQVRVAKESAQKDLKALSDKLKEEVDSSKAREEKESLLLRQAKEENEKLKSEVASLREQLLVVDKLTLAQREAVEERSRLVQEESHLQSALDSLRNGLAQKVLQLEDVQFNAQKWRSEASEAQKQLASSESRLVEARAEIDSLNEKCTSLQKSVEDRLVEVEELKLSLESVEEKHIAEMNALSSKLEDDVRTMKQKFSSLEDDIRSSIQVFEVGSKPSDGADHESPTSNKTLEVVEEPLSARRSGEKRLETVSFPVLHDAPPTVTISGGHNLHRSAPDTFAGSTSLSAPSTPVLSHNSSSVMGALDMLMGKSRDHIAAELIKTEQDYLEDLTALDDVVLAPLRAGAVLKPEQAVDVFVVDLLVQSNMRMLAQLQKQPEVVHIPRILSDFIDAALKPYSEYCSGAFAVLTDLLLKNSAKWAAFRKKVETHPRLKGLPLDAVLIKPIQRLCRYPLLLAELKKNTPQGMPLYEDLKNVMEKFNRGVSTINEIRRESELMHRAFEIERHGVSGMPVNFQWWGTDRHLLRDEAIDVMYPSNKGFGKRKRLLVWMFTDCIVLAKRSKMMRIATAQAYQCVSVLWFSSLTISDLPDNSEKGVSNAIEFVDTSNGGKKSVLFCFPMKETKAEWMGRLDTILKVAMVQKRGLVHQSSFKKVMNPLPAAAKAMTLGRQSREELSRRSPSVSEGDSESSSRSFIAGVIPPPPSGRGHRRSKSAGIGRDLSKQVSSVIRKHHEVPPSEMNDSTISSTDANPEDD